MVVVVVALSGLLMAVCLCVLVQEMRQEMSELRKVRVPPPQTHTHTP